MPMPTSIGQIKTQTKFLASRWRISSIEKKGGICARF